MDLEAVYDDIIIHQPTVITLLIKPKIRPPKDTSTRVTINDSRLESQSFLQNL